MCFTNLPIAFDGDGRPALTGPDADFGLDRGPRPRPAPTRPVVGAALKELRIDPVTRVAGALAFHATVDPDRRVVTEAWSEAVLFRGYELILRDRHPLEALDITSRACGVCGGVHTTCAAMTLEMVFGLTPPPMVVVARGLAQAAELLYDHCMHLFLLAGPDYCEEVVRRTTPDLWARAARTAAPNAGVHGLRTIGEIMTGLTPLRGSLALEALEVTRSAREIISLIYGKYPHPSAVVPGGLGTSLDHSTLNQVLARMVRLVDVGKRVATVWDDLVGFFYDADPGYALVGLGRTNLISTGTWDDPALYDATYEHADEWGAARLAPPGVVVDGELRTTRLTQIGLGIEEFVAHSYYEQWAGAGLPDAPDGAPLSPHHPWNKRTIPRPEPRSWKDRYSWATSPRWDREPMESGPLARQWMIATAATLQTEFIQTSPGVIRLAVPASTLPAMELQWRRPPVCNALERNRARAFHVPFCLMIGYSYLFQAFDLLRDNRQSTAAPFQVRDGTGVGFWEAGRGSLTHFCVVEKGRLANYQILTPSTWMAGPRDPWGVPGPYEDAVAGTPILEDSSEPVGIDVLRAVRSFDPCLPCAVHLDTGRGTVTYDATTCACAQG